MIFSVNTGSGVPIYLQVVQQVKHRVACGELSAGDKLPSVRDLAEQLQVNPNTVAKAILDLERQGIVETRRGSGTFIAEQSSTLSLAERRRLINQACDRAAIEGFHLGWSPEDIKAIFNARIDQIFRDK